MHHLGLWIGLAIWIAISYLPAWFGAQFSSGQWYDTLVKPDWSPPAWVFGPVWTVLYLLMGVAAWLVWKRAGFAKARIALALFLVQLAFNAAWSWIFFGLRQPGAAFAEIMLLWLLILATLTAFWRHHRLAGSLLLPYWAWVSFAALLNFAVWRLNSGLVQ